MPPGMTHEQHLGQMEREAEMKQHGNMAMGFDQDKATHHFMLTVDGGVIAVTANDPADQTTRDRIRRHLGEIAQAFARGDFQKPAMTHGELPAGASAMDRLKDRIAYAFVPSERGGAVRITTSDRAALEAVHEFLRYQITEHATGDPVTVQK
jgi:superfamily II DNA helicase RecQ